MLAEVAVEAVERSPVLAEVAVEGAQVAGAPSTIVQAVGPQPTVMEASVAAGAVGAASMVVEAEA